MSETPEIESTREAQTDAAPIGGVRRVIPWVLTVLVLAAAGGISYYWLMNQPTAQRRPPAPTAARVDVQPVQPTEETVILSAMGTVIPAREMSLASRVAGEVVSVSDRFVPGGRLTPKDVAVSIDPADYRLDVRQREADLAKASADVAQATSVILQRKADVAKADADLVMEQGRRDAALGEYELLGESVSEADKDLVLREPQLKQAQASVAAAKAALVSADASLSAAKAAREAAEVLLEQAKLDLSRTQIRPPFDAVVLSRNVNVGSNVAVNAALASLAGTEQYWVEISIPVDQIQWLRIPGFNSTAGSEAKVFCDSAWSSYRKGTVARLVGQIESEGRMARVLVAVDDPLDLKAKPDERRPADPGRLRPRAVDRPDAQGRGTDRPVEPAGRAEGLGHGRRRQARHPRRRDRVVRPGDGPDPQRPEDRRAADRQRPRRARRGHGAAGRRRRRARRREGRAA